MQVGIFNFKNTIYNLVTFTPSGTNVPPPSGREALSAPSLRELSAKLTEGVLKLWIVILKIPNHPNIKNSLA